MRIVLTGSTGHTGSVVRRPRAEGTHALVGRARRLPGGPDACDDATPQAPDAARRRR
ncbi:hypothetical protein [Streptomyces violarus]|uniref:Uncharacterized protein n=1 Tax=Streptomyces violarus TaxID=67380 RepID=A0A7W4ZYJ6_9ACTN|nr:MULTISPECIES: hypothetical protein [Streptomyces]MBB3080811.1 hypothetical protein [Streptomyces violarus]WRT96203.1 hypothetical protein VJ737_00190 [Streptomyces sp. CGMCC 4.1772]